MAGKGSSTATQSPPSAAPAAPAPPPAPARRAPIWRTTFALFLLFCVAGVVPVAFAGQTLGYWRISLPGVPSLFGLVPPPPDLALPRQAWIGTGADVYASPATGAPIARLEPGYPVRLTTHQAEGGASWSHIVWAGPTAHSGGDGWVPDTAITSAGNSKGSIGDLGALSPALARALSANASHLSVAIYFPASGRLYHTQPGQAIALGTSFRTVLLGALYAHTEGTFGTPVTTTPGTPGSVDIASAPAVASGDVSTAGVYTALGDAPGLSAYMTDIGVSGIQPALGDWTGASGSADALLRYYTLLADGKVLTSADRATALALLAHSNGTAPAPLSPSALGSSGLLVLGSAQASSGVTLTASAIAQPANGPRYLIVAAARDQATQADAQQILASFFQQLGATLAP
jgi:hypothetical protein